MKAIEQTQLDDATRSVYLKSMGITQWVPRESQLEDETPAVEVQFEEKSIPNQDKTIATPEPAEIISPHESTAVNIEPPKSSHYLKLVNWQNNLLKEEGCKKLLVICRHQIDQPASSFATASSPSQFMLDYINSLLSLLESNDIHIKVELAHLATAGLTEESTPMDKHLSDNSPDLVLVLGDETVKHLLDESLEVSKVRGQLLKYENNQSLMVSYHPYSLITNPAIKSLALEDLKEVSRCLLSEI